MAARREELERAVHGLEATAAIARAIGGETAIEKTLELVVKRGRALVEAHDMLILLREGDELVVAAGAGHVTIGEGARVPLSGSTAGDVLTAGRPRRIADAVGELRISPEQLASAARRPRSWFRCLQGTEPRRACGVRSPGRRRRVHA